MARQPLTQAAGLHTAPAQTTAPPGGLARAENVIIRHRDLIEPRPGLLGVVFLKEIDGYADAIATFGDVSASRWLINQGTKLYYYTDDDQAATALSGTYSPADDENRRMAFANIMQRAYFTTANGLYRMGGQSGSWAALTPEAAGQFRPLIDFTNSHCVVNTSGAIASDRAAGFRCYLMKRDGNGREIRGPASNRVIIINPPTATANAGSMVRTGGNTVTVTTTAAHGFRPGDATGPNTAEVGPPAFGVGPFTIVSVPAFNQFTYTEAGANGVSAGGHTFVIGALAHFSLKILLPVGTTTSHVLRVFRSETSASAATTPSDDTYQIFEGSPSGGDIAAGFMTVTDNTPEVLLGPISYFSPSADGLEASNEPPPFAKEVAAFGGDNGRLLVGNVREPHRIELAILATGGASGIAAADTLTFARSGYASLVITWGTTLAADTAVLYSAGSVASDIERSALSLVDAINASTTNTFLWARYISGPDDAPGRILLEARDCLTTAFTAVASARGGAFNPVLTAALSSTQARFPNRVRWSASGQPDAFWENNKSDIGSASEELLRLMPLRENVIAIKENSAFLGSPTGGGFQWTPLVVDTRFFSGDSAAVLDNQVHVLTTSGMAIVGESGMALFGLPVKDFTEKLMLEPYYTGALGSAPGINIKNQARRVCCAVAKPAEGLYLVAVPDFDAAYGQVQERRLPAHVLCWNSLSRTWSTWSLKPTCMALDNAAGRLLMGDGIKRGRVRQELTKYSQTSRVLPAVDEMLSVTITARDSSAHTITVVNTAGISPGDGIWNSATLGILDLRTVTAVNHVTGKLTVEPWDGFGGASPPSTAIVLVANESYVEWLPFAGEDPASGKAFQGAQLHFKEYVGTLGEMLFGSELAPSMQRTKTISRYGWGLAPWGEKPWGDPPGPRNERALTKPTATRGAWLKVAFRIRDALAHWKLQGMTPIFEAAGGDKTRR